MTQRRSYQVGTGLFILLGFTTLAYLATQTTSIANFSQGPSYMLKAHFTNIGQLKLRAPVKLAGVRIGSVESIALDPDRLDAIVQMSIDKHYGNIPEDSSASIFTSGLLGDQYVGIQAGGSSDMFKDGGEFILTQPSMQLEDLIGKFLVSGSPAQKPADASNNASQDKPATNPPANDNKP
ncbi:MAG: outer membrane lipid asymmetry maintenance protein MlaD [Rhodanobacter sp.]|jgi:phospholipid/cholesterol/gamma-HCH transport system substrate-binding protein|nr:outer membrane lipid asymmetry maintenance protein MlaD [Rhodanobacter sp.]